MSLPGRFRHVRSRDEISCHVTPPPASYSPVGGQTYTKPEFSAFYSHLQVTRGQMKALLGHFRSVRSCYVIFCHVTAISCELQPCSCRSNINKTGVFRLLQPLPGDFRQNVTSGRLLVT